MKYLAFCISIIFSHFSLAMTDINRVKSVTIYELPELIYNPARAENQIKLASQTGFNTVWLVLPWIHVESDIGISPWGEINDSSYSGKINNSYLDNLKIVLGHLKKYNMKAMISLDYLGKGWSPKGVDPEYLIFGDNYTAFLRYTRFMSRFLNSHFNSSDLIILFHDEGILGPYKSLRINAQIQQSFRNYLFSRNNNLSFWSSRHKRSYVSWDEVVTHSFETEGYDDPRLQDTVGFINYFMASNVGNGSFAKTVKSILTNSLVGFHFTNFGFMDLRNDNYTLLNSPIQSGHGFDFISLAYYDSKENLIPIRVNLQTYLTKAKALFPGLKIFFGELGGVVCASASDCPVVNKVMSLSNSAIERQANFLKSSVNLLFQNNIGFNIWNLQEFDIENTEGSFGIYRKDGTMKLAGKYIQDVLTGCSFNGATISHGANVTAYLAANPPSDQSCQSEIRSCYNGILSGSYTESSCTNSNPSLPLKVLAGGLSTSYTPFAVWLSVQGATSNTKVDLYANGIFWGQGSGITLSGGTLTFLLPSNLAINNCNANRSDCVLKVVLKNASTNTVSPDFNLSLPSVAIAVNCTFNGKSVPSGSTVSAFEASSVPYGQTCKSQIRTCTQGVLSGTYTQPTCTVDLPAPVITRGGISAAYSPFAVWLNVSNINQNLKFEIYDKGIFWSHGVNQVLNPSGSLVSFNLPKNIPPSSCNVGKTCTIQIRALNTVTKQTSNYFTITLPRQ
jgi:hypothetical protein